MSAQDCLEQIKSKLILSSMVNSLAVVTERALGNRGYFRARMTLANGDFLEVSEYFLAGLEGCSTLEYRHQWMDRTKQRLIKRWDNARHFPELANFPHHIHVGSETEVIPGTVMSIIALIDLLEAELSSTCPE
jgi:hypothetical protein